MNGTSSSNPPTKRRAWLQFGTRTAREVEEIKSSPGGLIEVSLKSVQPMAMQRMLPTYSRKPAEK